MAPVGAIVAVDSEARKRTRSLIHNFY